MEYEVETIGNLDRDYAKKTVRHVNSTGRMPWIAIDEGSR